MLNQELISIEQSTQWDQIIATLPHAPAHTAAYNRAMMASSKRPTYLYVARATDFIAACPVAKRQKFETYDLVTPYGFGGFIAQGECADFSLQFDSFMRNEKILSSYLAVHPGLCQSQSVLNLCETTNSAVYLLDLKIDLDSLFANLGKTHRYEIRQMQQADIVVLESKQEILPNLLALYSQTLQRTDAASVYHFNEETLSELIQDKMTLALAAREAGEIVAITLLIYNKHIADYFINAANDSGREYTRALLWRGIEHLHHCHIPTLNLGGGVKPNDNLEQFKRRFAGEKVLQSVLKRIYDEKLYYDVCMRSMIDVNNTQYFPAYHAV